ncbi:MAG: M24 family metallopeptidase, partial [bacterium]
MRFDRVAQLDETGEKRARLLKLMKERGLDAVVLSRRHNFSWATGGADNHVRHASDLGVASLVFLRGGSRWVLTSNIEAPRIMDEELAGLGFELKETRWYVPAERPELLRDMLRNMRTASDDGTPGTEDIEPHLPPLRMQLTKHEMEKYRWLGRQAGTAIGEVCRKATRAMTEEEVAGMLFAAMQRRSVKPTVLLVAADERISKYRHPIPTANKVKASLMIVLCARAWGLVCSVTRLVHFGKMPPELKGKHEAVCRVDAAMITASRVNAPYVDAFERGKQAYGEQGYTLEWQKHHQGGPTGYIEREFTVNP